MKISATTAILIAATGSSTYGAPPSRNVLVCMSAPPGPFGAATKMTSRMFAEIGVTLEWCAAACPSGVLQVKVSAPTPENLRPGALGYAMPFEGTHVVVFWDRVQAAAGDGNQAALLAHVLAHEITHILQGLMHHSRFGLMRANWDRLEIRNMIRPLPFAPEDVDLIYLGMARRRAPSNELAAPTQYHSLAAIHP